MRATVHAKFITMQDGIYPLYVFENLEENRNSLLKFITTTRLPNWSGSLPNIGDVGFLECEYVDAGDEYYKRNTGNLEQYKYTACYFLNFIKEKEKIENKDYKF